MKNSTWVDWLEEALQPKSIWGIPENCSICLFYVIFYHLILIQKHFSCWEKPKEQRIIVLLLVIPPICAFVSYIGLVFPTSLVFLILDSIKECYAALIFPLLLSLHYSILQLNDEELSPKQMRLILGRRLISRYFPDTLIKLVKPECVYISLKNLKLFEYWAWQCVVIRFVCSVLTIVLQLLGVYPVWLSCVFFVILNVSVFLAYYPIYVFYQAFFKTFKTPERRKYLFFNMIFFACFFQGAVFNVLNAIGIIIPNLQNILVIVEMMFVSVISHIAFPTSVAPLLPVVQPACK